MASNSKLDPTIGEDRIAALFSNYTSKENECQFYISKNSYGNGKSSCQFDQLSRRVWDCKGQCFSDGFTCNYITQYQDQFKKLAQIASKKTINF